MTTGALVLSAPAHADDNGYYKTPYSSTIYLENNGVAAPVTYSQWVAAGSPTPRAGEVTYGKYSWDPTIYRNVTFGSWPFEQHHVETGAEWAQAGYPTPGVETQNYLSFHQWATSAEVFAVPPNDAVHKLTAAQWNSVGNLGPGILPDQGFEKLTWASPIAKMDQVSRGFGSPISYSEWAAEDFPTPASVQRFPGDQFYRYENSSTIIYAGPTMNRAVTYAEWSAAGRPAPTVKATSAVTSGAFCSTNAEIGNTTGGTAMTCKTSATDTRLRWRAS